MLVLLFLDLEVTIARINYCGWHVYIYDERDKILLFNVRMPHLCSSITSSIFFNSFSSALLGTQEIGTLLFSDFFSKTSGIYH